ncbi:MAG: universal stress protein [Prosthecobacter sp.]|nr:universal stress protein [Prosthecobacter sp.]
MTTPTHWRKILVSTDFSDASLAALREARCVQQLTQAEVVLVHVTKPAFDGLRVHTGGDHHEIQTAARQQLESLAKAHFPDELVISTLVKDGQAGEVICDLARNLKADVIFIATHGVSAVKHLMLGSVVENVVRHAPCSVLVVR